MTKEILLFNYFVQKLIEFEMKELKVPTFELALTNLLLYEEVERSFLATSGTIYTIPRHLEHLLFVVCMYDIDKTTGAHALFDVFDDFEVTHNAVKNTAIATYLQTLYQVHDPKTSPNLYSVTQLRRSTKISFIGPIWVGAVSNLEVSAPCWETERIDKALKELFKIPEFVKLFANEYKVGHINDIMQSSPALRFLRAYGPTKFHIKNHNAINERNNFFMDFSFKPNSKWAQEIIKEKCVINDFYRLCAY